MVMRELHLQNAPALKDLVHWQPVVFGGVQDAQRAVHHGGRWGAGRGGSLNFMPGGGETGLSRPPERSFLGAAAAAAATAAAIGLGTLKRIDTCLALLMRQGKELTLYPAVPHPLCRPPHTGDATRGALDVDLELFVLAQGHAFSIGTVAFQPHSFAVKVATGPFGATSGEAGGTSTLVATALLPAAAEAIFWCEYVKALYFGRFSVIEIWIFTDL